MILSAASRTSSSEPGVFMSCIVAAGTVKAKGKRKGTEPEEMAATATAAAATGAETGRRRRK